MFAIKNGSLFSGNAKVEQIPSKNHSGAFPSAPKLAVIHYTAGGSGRSSARWFADAKNPSSSAHIVIDRDGSIIQCVSFENVAWHAGKSTWGSLQGLNKYSIGIELANWGPLKGSGSNWVNAAGQTVLHPFMGIHRNGNPDGSKRPIGWEAYAQAQIETAIQVVVALRAAYPIAEIVGHDDISPIRKSDPGPAFDMAQFRSRVLGDRKSDAANTATVVSINGLNLRTGPGTGFPAIKLLADKTLVEPIGRDGVWLEVSELNAQKQPIMTGWVHGHYVRLD